MKQAVLAAIAHKRGETLPYCVELTSQKRKSLCELLGIPEAGYFDYAGNMIEKADYITGETIKPGFYRDCFGVVWDRSGLDKDIGIVQGIQINESNYRSYRCPEVDEHRVRLITESLLASPRDTLKLGKLSITLFERAWSLRGLTQLLMDFHLNPKLVRHLLDQIMIYNTRVLDIALEYDVDGMYFGDDFGTQTGLMFSPDTWREYFKPCYEAMFRQIKAKGKLIALHSCGDIGRILPDLVDIGLDIYQTVQPEIYDLPTLKREYGASLCFWGGISTQRLLPFATKVELTDTLRRTIDVMAKDGGYIASPTHQVPADVSDENILTLLDVLKKGYDR